MQFLKKEKSPDKIKENTVSKTFSNYKQDFCKYLCPNPYAESQP